MFSETHCHHPPLLTLGWARGVKYPAIMEHESGVVAYALAWWEKQQKWKYPRLALLYIYRLKTWFQISHARLAADTYCMLGEAARHRDTDFFSFFFPYLEKCWVLFSVPVGRCFLLVSSCSSSIPLHKQSKALPRCKNIIAVCAECSYMYVTFLLNDEATCLLFKFVSPFFLQWAKTYICKILLLIRNRPEYFYCHGRFFFLSSVKNFYVFFLLFYEFKNRWNAFWVTGVSY